MGTAQGQWPEWVAARFSMPHTSPWREPAAPRPSVFADLLTSIADLVPWRADDYAPSAYHASGSSSLRCSRALKTPWGRHSFPPIAGSPSHRAGDLAECRNDDRLSGRPPQRHARTTDWLLAGMVDLAHAGDAHADPRRQRGRRAGDRHRGRRSRGRLHHSCRCWALNALWGAKGPVGAYSFVAACR